MVMLQSMYGRGEANCSRHQSVIVVEQGRQEQLGQAGPLSAEVFQQAHLHLQSQLLQLTLQTLEQLVRVPLTQPDHLVTQRHSVRHSRDS